MRIAPAPQRLFKRQTEQDGGARNGNATGIASAATPSLRAQGTGRGSSEATSQAQRGKGAVRRLLQSIEQLPGRAGEAGLLSPAQGWQTEQDSGAPNGNQPAWRRRQSHHCAHKVRSEAALRQLPRHNGERGVSGDCFKVSNNLTGAMEQWNFLISAGMANRAE